VCVDVGGDLVTGVAEQLRDGPEVNSVFEHRRRGGVAQRVDRPPGDRLVSTEQVDHPRRGRRHAP